MLYLAFEESKNNEETYKEVSLLNDVEYTDKNGNVFLTFGKWYTSKELAIVNLFGEHVFKRMMNGLPSKNFWLVELDVEKADNLTVIIDGQDETDPRYFYDITSPDTTIELVPHQLGIVTAELYKLFNVDKSDVIKTNGYRYGHFIDEGYVESYDEVVELDEVEYQKNGYTAVGSYSALKDDNTVEYRFNEKDEWKDIDTLKKNDYVKLYCLEIRVPVSYNYIFDYSAYPHEYLNKEEIPIRKIYRMDLADALLVDRVEMYRTFEPRIPDSGMFGECCESERVCFSTTLVGCMTAVPWMWETVDNTKFGTLVWITEYEDIDDGTVIYDTATAVPDAPLTQECWLMKNIRAKSRLAVITNVYYTAKSYKVKTKVDDIISYNTAIDRISSVIECRRIVYDINGVQILTVEEAAERLKNGDELYYDSMTSVITSADIRYVRQEEITMSRELDLEELKKLNERIKECDIAYYQNNNSLISDYEYDMLVKRAEEILEKYPELRSNINQKIGNIVFDKVGTGTTNTPFKKVKHVAPMLSLKNTYNKDELKSFVKNLVKVISEGKDKWKFSLDLEYKLDGISCEILYEDGFIKQALTRGDGEYGEDITHNVRAASRIIQRIGTNKPVRVRGELIIDLKAFGAINLMNELAGKEKYANPRNLVSGVMRRDKPNSICEEAVRFEAYGLADYTDMGNSHLEALEVELSKLGIYSYVSRNTFSITEKDNIDNIVDAIYIELDKIYRSKQGDNIFPIDGAVLKLDDISLRSLFEDTSKYPKWAIAYKFKDDIVSTKLISVSCQVGRTGRITPVAQLNPVHINGTVVTYSTLHNFEEISRLGINLGDMVDLKKAAEIIPKIVGKSPVDREENEHDNFFGIKPIKVPTKCPECGTDLIVESLSDIYCPNVDCKGRVKALIEYFVSKPCMNIVGLGPKSVSTFYDKGILKSIPDIYRLSNTVISQSPTVTKIIASINASKEQPLHRVLTSLGIPECGPSFCKEITKKYKSIQDIREAIAKGLIPSKYVSYKNFIAWMKDEKNIAMIDKLLEYGLTMVENTNSSTGIKFKDITYAITGKSDVITRDELKLFIVENGGNVSSSINKTVDVLLYGDKAGGKLEDAKKRGIQLYSINDFIDDNRNELAALLKRSM